MPWTSEMRQPACVCVRSMVSWLGFFWLTNMTWAVVNPLAAGAGTIKVTYNNQTSAGSPITVVANGLGIYTVSQNGTGPAIITYADYSLVTTSKASNPGETLILWATGLGPVSGAEAAGPLPGDMTNIPVKVWVGSTSANVTYRGR